MNHVFLLFKSRFVLMSLRVLLLPSWIHFHIFPTIMFTLASLEYFFFYIT